MARVRAIWRLITVAALTGFFYILLVVGTLVALPSRSLRIRCRNFCMRNWSRSLLATLNARVENRGTAPTPPFFLVTNHLSYIDILVLASRVDAIFIAKSEIAGWPLIGLLCRSVGTLFVDRKRRRDIPRVNAAIDRTFDGGQGIILFPEGTSTRGLDVAGFRPSLLDVAVRSGHPVSYATLTYSTEPEVVSADLAVCWWGDMEFVPHFLNLLKLRSFYASLIFGEESIQEDDRKLLAERLWQAVSRQFVPVATKQDTA
jgi:1-acyl-sn-glycerol-3-phosphate acyltransferase